MEDKRTLYANDGMVLTNGEVYGTTIYLAKGTDETSFYEITKDEYKTILEKEEEVL